LYQFTGAKPAQQAILSQGAVISGCSRNNMLIGMLSWKLNKCENVGRETRRAIVREM